MKAMILAAGLGTRLKPWTLSHPKALVPVGGVPMLERVILSLKSQGFNSLVVNVHHFADQIIDFLSQKDFGVEIAISDESGELLDTGGGILHAEKLLVRDSEPFLVHNVDILSNAPLTALMERHQADCTDATLLVSNRDSSRKLLWDSEMNLRAWKNTKDNALRLKHPDIADGEWQELAFSGIYVLSTDAFRKMRHLGDRFPIMDWFLEPESVVKGMEVENLQLIDIGKPETLEKARLKFGSI